MKYAYKIYAGRYEGKRPVRGRRPRWDNNVILEQILQECWLDAADSVRGLKR